MQVWQLFGTVNIKDEASNKLKHVQHNFQKTSETAKTEGGLMSTSLGKLGAVMAGAFAVGKIIDFGKETVVTSAKIQALDSMFTQTFKDSAQKAMVGINAQAQEQNINVDRLRGTWSSFFGTFKGNGADVNQSLDLTKRYMQLAGDGAAYYDKSLDEVVARMKSIIMGNFEAGDAIGININATKMDIKAKKEYKKKWQELNDTQKEFLLLNTVGKIYENNGAMGQGAREANNYENVIGNLKITWQRFVGTLGSPILTVVVKVLQLITDGVKSLVGWITQAIQPFQAWADGLELSANKSSVMTNALNALKEIFGALKTFVVSVIGTLVASIQDWYNNNQSTISGIINVIMNCMSTIKGIIQDVTTVVMAIWNTFGKYILDFAVTCFSFVLQKIQSILNIIGGIFKIFASLIKGDWSGLWNGVKQIVKGIFLFIYQLIFNALLGKVLGVIKGFGSKIIGLFTGNGNGLKKTVKVVWDFITKHISGVVKKILSVIKGAWSGISKITSTVFNAIKTIITTVVKGWFKIIQTVLKTIANVVIIIWNAIFKKTSGLWKNIGKVIKVVVKVIKTVITTYFKVIKTIITTIWKHISNITSKTWKVIQTVIKTVVKVIKTIITTAWRIIKTTTLTIWNGIKAVITTVIKVIKTVITTAWKIIKTVTMAVWNAIKVTITTIINVIKTIISTVFNVIKTIITTIWDTIMGVIKTIVTAIKEFIENRFNSIKEFITNVFNVIKEVINVIWQGIKNVITIAINVIKTIIVTVFNTIKTVTTTVWNGIKACITGVFSGIKSVVHGAVNFIKSIITGVWNGIKSTTIAVWNGIKEGITKPIHKAKETVKKIIDKIKGFFNFTWELPALKMPHLDITGEFSIMPPSVPSFDIQWYAEGGILTKPTAFGMNGNMPMVGGEAGPEAVLPIEKLGGILADTLGQMGYGGQQPIIINIDGKQVFNALSPYLAMASRGRRS